MTASAPAVWMCPECGHGSADPRDERAHLDAHRQLRAFFEEWEAGTEAPATDGRRRSRWLVRLALVAAALVMLLVSSSVYSRINRSPDPGLAQVAPVDVRPAEPSGAPPATSPPASPPAAVASPPAAVTSSPVTAPRAVASPKPTAVAPAAATQTPARAQSQAAAPTTTVPATSPPATATAPAPAPPAHLVSLCLPGICVNLL